MNCYMGIRYNPQMSPINLLTSTQLKELYLAIFKSKCMTDVAMREAHEKGDMELVERLVDTLEPDDLLCLEIADELAFRVVNGIDK